MLVWFFNKTKNYIFFSSSLCKFKSKLYVYRIFCRILLMFPNTFSSSISPSISYNKFIFLYFFITSLIFLWKISNLVFIIFSSTSSALPLVKALFFILSTTTSSLTLNNNTHFISKLAFSGFFNSSSMASACSISLGNPSNSMFFTPWLLYSSIFLTFPICSKYFPP